MKKGSLTSFLVKIFSIIIIGMGATLAWFSNFDADQAGGEITIDVDPFSAISVKNTTIRPDNFHFSDFVSGNGETFYKLNYNKRTGEMVYQEVDLETAKAQHLVFEGTIEFETFSNLDLYMGTNCYVVPLNDSKISDILTSGCIRIAMIYEGRVVETWAPNMNVRYIKSTFRAPYSVEVWNPVLENGVEQNTSTVVKHTSGRQSESRTENVKFSSEEAYSIFGESELGFMWNTGSRMVYNKATIRAASGWNSSIGIAWGTLPSSESVGTYPYIFTVRDASTNGKKDIVVTFRIWLEGTDREANENTFGGSVNAHFSFFIKDVETEEEP